MLQTGKLPGNLAAVTEKSNLFLLGTTQRRFKPTSSSITLLLNASQGQNAPEQQQLKQISDQELRNSPFQSNTDQGTENLTLPSKGLLDNPKGPIAMQRRAQQLPREVQSRHTPC